MAILIPLLTRSLCANAVCCDYSRSEASHFIDCLLLNHSIHLDIISTSHPFNGVISLKILPCPMSLQMNNPRYLSCKDILLWSFCSTRCPGDGSDGASYLLPVSFQWL